MLGGAALWAAAPTPPAWPAELKALLDFESAQGWEGGIQLVKSPVKSGAQSARWAFGETTGFYTSRGPTNWSQCKAISFWVHSARASRAEFMVILPSRRDPKVNSYYSHKVIVDWTGWRQLQLPLADFDEAREPAGWDKIESLRFTASGWGLNPDKATVLHVDGIEFVAGAAPASRRGQPNHRLYVQPPPPEEFLRRLRREHPRLMLTSADVARLKREIPVQPQLREWYAEVKKQADRTLKAEPGKYEKPDGRRLLSVSRRVVDRVYALGFVYLMGEGEAYLRRAWRELEAAGNFPDWNPSHYLDTAEMMHAFGIGYDWLYHGLTENERAFIRGRLYQHGLRLSANTYRGLKSEGMQSWKTVENNWNFVCNGGSAMAAMAVLDELPEPCTVILSGTFTNIQIPLAHFEPDGAWWEGLGYWHYSLRYFAPYLKCLESAFGTDFGFVKGLQGTGFSRTGDFPIHLVTPLGGIYNFADSGSGGSQFGHAAFFFLADKFQNPLYHWYQIGRPKHDVNDLLYFRPLAQTPEVAAAPLDRHFRGAEVAVWRNSWTAREAGFVGFKAGRNGIAHSHEDLGSFVLYALGEPWLVDLGTEHQTYLAHQHSFKRSEFYRIRAEGHNTLVINPGAGPDQNPKGAASIERFESQPHQALLVADLTGAYAGVKKVRRGLRYLNHRGALLVQDEIEAERESDLWWFAHTPGKIVLTADKRGAVISQRGKKLQAVLLSPPGAVWQALPAAPLPSSPNPPIQEKNEKYSKLAIHCQGRQATIAAAFAAVYDFEDAPPPRPVVQPLAQWTLAPAPPMLADLQADGRTVKDFAPGVFNYWLPVPASGAPPKLMAAARDAQARVAITAAAQVPGRAEITVTDPRAPANPALYRVYFVPQAK